MPLYHILLYSTLLCFTLLYSSRVVYTLLYAILLNSALPYSTLLHSTLHCSTLLFFVRAYSIICYYALRVLFVSIIVVITPEWGQRRRSQRSTFWYCGPEPSDGLHVTPSLSPSPSPSYPPTHPPTHLPTSSRPPPTRPSAHPPARALTHRLRPLPIEGPCGFHSTASAACEI